MILVSNHLENSEFDFESFSDRDFDFDFKSS